MMASTADDCILIDEPQDNSCDGEKSAHVISVPASPDDTENVTFSAAIDENKVMSAESGECPAAVQQDNAVLQSTETLHHSQNTSKLSG